MKAKVQTIIVSLSTVFFILIIFGFTQSKTKEVQEKQTFRVTLPIGTIISSSLEFSKFVKAAKDGKTFNSRRSKWAPADGRNVSNSDYHKLTQNSIVPDLRGQFVRGKNQFLVDGLQSPSYTNGKDPDDRVQKNGYSYQTDKIKDHVHPYKVNYTGGGSIGGNAALGSNGVGNEAFPETKGNIKEGKETRPKNMSVYYYIRINN